ncbi:hypothetical protein HOD75_05125 [archaeon]|jgi:enolase|nr:hypothetical protein [Candidatus Woesearchaeota archaeon]MBT4136112.1 hypothetical protein [archaeon]MBT4242243.1 hypothetical protein [archaeon]MBT4417931.1 hypothetical protein [archaeon]
MILKKIIAKAVKDSRGEKTILVGVVNSAGKVFETSAPAGKSKGKFEVKSYFKSLSGDIKFLNGLNVSVVNGLKLKRFDDLVNIEKLVSGKIGGNSLFALEASILKAIAFDKGVELYEFLDGVVARRKKGKKGINIRPVGNTIGGGLHSKGVKGKKPEFQEFLFIAKGKNFKERVKINETAYVLARKFLKSRSRNDEGAWETGCSNEEVLDIMSNVRKIMKKKGLVVDIGLDVASSSFLKNKKYVYWNNRLSQSSQINYLIKLIQEYKILYVEDGLDENDFSGFRKLMLKGKFLNVGDDLTTTNLKRVKKAIRMNSINAMIIKPNQIGSLIEVKEVIAICRANKIKTIISHRSGETLDNTIADLGVGFNVDFIKTGVYGDVRKSKLKRIIEIEGKL